MTVRILSDRQDPDPGTGLSPEVQPTAMVRVLERFSGEKVSSVSTLAGTLDSAALSSLMGMTSLASRNNGRAMWIRGSTSPLDQKGATGWLAELYGGVQTGWDDYARLNIPVNEMRLQAFNSALWSYYMTATESMGVNIVIYVHDPTDFDKRAEITQQADIATLVKASGWNAHNLDTGVAQFYWYGENCTGTVLTEGAPNYYKLTQFQADPLFGSWTVYRVSLDFGWQTGGDEFNSAYVADVKINGQMIPLGPMTGRHQKTVAVQKTMVADAKAAGDVWSEHASTGTYWTFDFGGKGYITNASIMHDAAITERFRLYLFSNPPTSETDDNVANTSPLTADALFFLPPIEFPAMRYTGTGDAFTVATPNTYGNLPIAFPSPIVYGILVGLDGATAVAEALTIMLTADMEDN